MQYEVWDLTIYSEGEEPIPFTKQYESDILSDAINFMETSTPIPLALVVDNKVMVTNLNYVFERDGDVVYKRHSLSKIRTKVI